MVIEKATLFETPAGDKLVVTCGEKEDGSFKSADISIVRKDGMESLVAAFEYEPFLGDFIRMFAYSDEYEKPIYVREYEVEEA